MRVIRTEPALGAIIPSYDDIWDFNPRAAMHLADTPRVAGGSLEVFPHRSRPVPGTGMRELVAFSPYIIK